MRKLGVVVKSVVFAALYAALLGALPTLTVVLSIPNRDSLPVWVALPSVLVFLTAVLWLRPRFSALNRVRGLARHGQPAAYSWYDTWTIMGHRGMGPGGFLVGLPAVLGVAFLYSAGLVVWVGLTGSGLLALLAVPLIAMGFAFFLPRLWLSPAERGLLASLRATVASGCDDASVGEAVEALVPLVAWPGSRQVTVEQAHRADNTPHSR